MPRIFIFLAHQLLHTCDTVIFFLSRSLFLIVVEREISACLQVEFGHHERILDQVWVLNCSHKLFHMEQHLVTVSNDRIIS